MVINLINYKTGNIKNDLLSGIVVAFVLVPGAVAFSFIAGVSPIIGLYTAFILGLIVSLISGATGAVAVVLVGLGVAVQEHYQSMGLSEAQIAGLVVSQA